MGDTGSCWCGKPSRRGGGWCGECKEDPPRCAHGMIVGSYDCAKCTGPLSDTQLDMIRRRLAGHEECVPRCDRAPSGETARLLATIDALRDPGERDPLGKLTTIEVLREENASLRGENGALRGMVDAAAEMAAKAGNTAMAESALVFDHLRSIAAADMAAEMAVKANAEGLYVGAKSMRDACAAMAREVAKSGNTLMATCAAAIASAIESLPLPK